MTEIKHIITEDWVEELLRNIIGDEEIVKLKYPTNEYGDLLSQFKPQQEWLQITIKRIPK